MVIIIRKIDRKLFLCLAEGGIGKYYSRINRCFSYASKY